MSTALRAAALTVVALCAFAANSLLCRLALGGHAIDAASFTAIRLASGAILLFALGLRRRGNGAVRGGWTAPLALFAYAAAFSYAYLVLSAGTGALLLFGSVQLTMIAAALRSGERIRVLEGAGLVIALAGLVYLVLPGVHAPPALGSALMAAAGIAWGVYSLRGRGSAAPERETARNFALATPCALGLAAASFLLHGAPHITPRGALLAAASGALTSGLGYVVWFAALRHLSALRAATVQLLVPALAATGGVLFLGERWTQRLILAGIAILGGIALAITQRSRTPTPVTRR